MLYVTLILTTIPRDSPCINLIFPERNWGSERSSPVIKILGSWILSHLGWNLGLSDPRANSQNPGACLPQLVPIPLWGNWGQRRDQLRCGLMVTAWICRDASSVTLAALSRALLTPAFPSGEPRLRRLPGQPHGSTENITVIPSNSPAFSSEESTELLFLPAGPDVIICEADKHTNAHDFELWE